VSHELPPPVAASEPGHEATRTLPTNHTPTGAGSEAAEGIHDSGTRLGGERSSLDSRETGRSFRAGAERSGSEPLVERAWVHESGYGGKGGTPRTSSDQREAAEQASGASSGDASDVIGERPPSPLRGAVGNVDQAHTPDPQEQVTERTENSDTGAPAPTTGGSG
jgi:hypothetical protein